METIKTKLKPNPRDDANILSILFFAWTIPLFRTSSSKVLEIEDICQPQKCDQSKVLGNRLESIFGEKKNDKKSSKPSLLKAIAKLFWKEFLLLGILCLMNDVIIRIVQPQLLRQFLLHFKSNPDINHFDAILFASGMVILNGLGVLIINQLFMTGYHNGMKMRIAVCSLIYRKALRLSHAALETTSPGKIINLMANDVSRFDAMSMYLHSMWTAPLLVVIVAYLLWLEVRWAGMFGLLIVFIVVPIQSYAGKLSAKFRSETAIRTDERIRFMDEIISGIQVIKMYAWERPFMKLITLARQMELKVVKKNSYVRALYMTFAMVTTRMALFCTLVSILFLYGEENITAAKVFVVSSYFSVVAQTMSQMFVRGVAEIAEGLVAFERIQTFLESEEKLVKSTEPNAQQSKENNKSSITSTEIIVNDTKDVLNSCRHSNEYSNIKRDDEYVVHIRNMSAKWISTDYETFGLSNINLEFRKHGKLIGVIGSIGSGKSSLLQALLQEMPIESGLLNINGIVSHACQDPWVFASSVRQNILFGEKMDRKRYDLVVTGCALEKDIDQLEYGDRTLVGERGILLSGGQKARINLARAIYRKADIYLLDDPLSAVDTHVGLHLFNECIGPKGILARQRATRILVTHQIHFLKNVDWLIIMQNGKIAAQGQPSDLIALDFDPIQFLQFNDHKNDCHDNNNQRRRKISRISSRSKSISITSLCSDYESVRRESEFDPGLIESLQFYDENTNEPTQGSSLRQYFRSGANFITLFVLLMLFILAQLTASGADFWVSFWISQEEHRNTSILDSMTNGTITIIETLNDAYVDTDTCVIVYSILIFSIFAVAIIRSLTFYNVCMKASQHLHDNMFTSIISTTMRFFNISPSGRIMNRFARDIGSVDEILPRVLLDAIQTNLNMIGAIVLTSIVNPIFLIPLSFISIIFLIARNIYLRTSKNIKRLEGITRSPVYTHLSVSLDGLSTIRAFNAERILIEEFDNHQDIHSACWYTFISTSCAFGFVLDVMCFVLVFVVIYSFLLIDTGISGDKVGLAITQSMTMTGLFQWGIRHSVEVTNQLISVERILEYSELEPEKQPKKQVELPLSWPSEGRIEFRQVSYKYSYETESVLNRISFEILPKFKVGIVGRTGAGKSSIIGALFRLAYVKGEISIDGIDTANINLEFLRSKIAIIPQNPVLFSGSLRINLDPFSEYSDADIYNALEEIKMKHIACGTQGLELAVLANGGNFSIGQRQLLCLARAILRKNRILVLDEATSNVDVHTDELIQQTIRVKFADCTVLTVAHRLHTIIDSDRILVVDTGKCVEFDSPFNLLTKQTGIFKEMVQALGNKEYDRLFKIAQTKIDK